MLLTGAPGAGGGEEIGPGDDEGRFIPAPGMAVKADGLRIGEAHVDELPDARNEAMDGRHPGPADGEPDVRQKDGVAVAGINREAGPMIDHDLVEVVQTVGRNLVIIDQDGIAASGLVAAGLDQDALKRPAVVARPLHQLGLPPGEFADLGIRLGDLAGRTEGGVGRPEIGKLPVILAGEQDRPAVFRPSLEGEVLAVFQEPGDPRRSGDGFVKAAVLVPQVGGSKEKALAFPDEFLLRIGKNDPERPVLPASLAGRHVGRRSLGPGGEHPNVVPVGKQDRRVVFHPERVPVSRRRRGVVVVLLVKSDRQILGQVPDEAGLDLEKKPVLVLEVGDVLPARRKERPGSETGQDFPAFAV